LSFPGPLAAPGAYTVSLATRVDGQLNDTGLEVPIQVNVMRQNSLASASPKEIVAFGLRYDELSRQAEGAVAAVNDAVAELQATRATLMRSDAGHDLRQQASDLERSLLDVKLRISGDERMGMAQAQGPVPVSQRLSAVQMGTALSTYGPSPAHLRSLEIAEQEFAPLRQEITRIFEQELPALRRALDEAGVPWTPGRGVPAGD
jgi:hypothetical protein